MLNYINTAQYAPIQPDDRYNRNMKDDMKIAIDILWEFKEKLNKLHPECTQIINNMLQERYR